MTTQTKTLQDLFMHQLKDLYFAEQLILKTLPKLVKAAKDAKLKAALEAHHGETATHVSRLEQVFELLGKKPAAVPCEAIKGILLEGDEVSEEFGDSPVGDAGLVASCQAVEHYEITRYGTLRVWADELNLSEVSRVLSLTLKEEYSADDKLTAIATSKVNLAA